MTKSNLITKLILTLTIFVAIFSTAVVEVEKILPSIKTQAAPISKVEIPTLTDYWDNKADWIAYSDQKMDNKPSWQEKQQTNNSDRFWQNSKMNGTHNYAKWQWLTEKSDGSLCSNGNTKSELVIRQSVDNGHNWDPPMQFLPNSNLTDCGSSNGDIYWDGSKHSVIFNCKGSGTSLVNSVCVSGKTADSITLTSFEQPYIPRSFQNNDIGNQLCNSGYGCGFANPTNFDIINKENDTFFVTFSLTNNAGESVRVSSQTKDWQNFSVLQNGSLLPILDKNNNGLSKGYIKGDGVKEGNFYYQIAETGNNLECTVGETRKLHFFRTNQIAPNNTWQYSPRAPDIYSEQNCTPTSISVFKDTWGYSFLNIGLNFDNTIVNSSKIFILKWKNNQNVAPQLDQISCTNKVRIGTIGDSITHGGLWSSKEIGAGYRKELQKLMMTQINTNFDFVGDKEKIWPNTDSFVYDPDTSAQGAANTVTLKNMIENNQVFAKTNPHLTLVMASINNVYGTPQKEILRLNSMLEEIWRQAPETKILLSDIPTTPSPRVGTFPASGSANGSWQTWASEYNQLLNSVQSYFPNKQIIRVVQPILSSSDFADTVHPNTAGDEKIAKGFFEVLKTTPEFLQADCYDENRLGHSDVLDKLVGTNIFAQNSTTKEPSTIRLGLKGDVIQDKSIWPTANSASNKVRVTGDIDKDGIDDLVWHQDNGEVVVWLMNKDFSVKKNVTLSVVPKESWTLKAVISDTDPNMSHSLLWQSIAGNPVIWRLNKEIKNTSGMEIRPGYNHSGHKIMATGDIDKDGVIDYIWRYDSGEVVAWLMNNDGTTKKDYVYRHNVPKSDWTLRGIINADNKDGLDLLWQNNCGEPVWWLLNIDGSIKENKAIWSGYCDPTHKIAATGDIDKDGITDYIWHYTTGQVYVWLMKPDGGLKAFTKIWNNVPLDWSIKGITNSNDSLGQDLVWQHNSGLLSPWYLKLDGTIDSTAMYTQPTGNQIIGDINKDGVDDVIWHQDNGEVKLWLMNKNGVSSSKTIHSNVPKSDWTLRSVINADNKDGLDLLWQNNCGEPVWWLMNTDGTIKQGKSIWSGYCNATHKIAATGDIDRDGITDYVWHYTTGQIQIWIMNSDGTVKINKTTFSNVPQNDWTIRGIINADNLDGYDILWQNNCGEPVWWLLNTDGSIKENRRIWLGYCNTTHKIGATGDIDKDGLTDYIWHYTTGEIKVWFMNRDGTVKLMKDIITKKDPTKIISASL